MFFEIHMREAHAEHAAVEDKSEVEQRVDYPMVQTALPNIKDSTIACASNSASLLALMDQGRWSEVDLPFRADASIYLRFYV